MTETRQGAVRLAPESLRRPPSIWERSAPAIRAIVSIGAGLLIWEFIGRFVVTNRLFFVPFSDVAGTFADLVISGRLNHHLFVSGVEFGVGFGLAVVAGVLFGIVLGASRRLYEYFDPWISALYATPLVALTPFYILIFGIGVQSKIALVFTLAIFPALINTAAGIRAVDTSYLEVARAFRLSRRQVFSKVLVPAALPFIVSGLRLASGRGLIAVVVGELFFSSAGVGYLISIAAQTFDTSTMLAGVLIFAGAGVILTWTLRRLEARLSPWREV